MDGGYSRRADIFVLSPNVSQTAASQPAWREPSREKCKVEPLGSATWRWQVGGVARRRSGVGEGRGRGLAEDAAAGVAIFKTSNSSEPATAYFMGNAFRRRAFIFISRDLLPQRITRLRRRVPRTRMHVCTRVCDQARLHPLCGAMRPRNIRPTCQLSPLFAARFLFALRPTD